MSAWECYKKMCASLHEDGISTEGMYVAYLRGELRNVAYLRGELHEARQRINELEGQANE
jgi:hypothetical protein